MWHAVADPPFLRLLYIQYKFFSKFTILVILSFHRKSFLSRNLITFLSGGEQQRSFTVARFFNWFCLFRFASLTNKIDCKGNILNKISNYQMVWRISRLKPNFPIICKWCSDQNHGTIFILQTFPAVGTDEDECPLRGAARWGGMADEYSITSCTQPDDDIDDHLNFLCLILDHQPVFLIGIYESCTRIFFTIENWMGKYWY